MRHPEIAVTSDGHEPRRPPWEPVPRQALLAWCAFYALFLFQVARGSGLLLLMDGVFVPVHEGGHLFFGYFGEFIGVAGGTMMQLGVPLALAIYFERQRNVQGTAFCTFFVFEQLLPTATYMADARAEDLPLITVGDSDDVIHDWNYLFSHLGCLDHDIEIARVVRFLGWLGMVGTLGWFLWRTVGERVIEQPNARAIGQPRDRTIEPS